MANRKITAAEFLAQAMDLSGKTQRDIATEAGWERPNVISMMKQGVTKIPVERVPALAKACGVDPALMIQIVMQEYQPELWRTLVSTLGEPLTEDEKQNLEEYRAQRDGVKVEEDELTS